MLESACMHRAEAGAGSRFNRRPELRALFRLSQVTLVAVLLVTLVAGWYAYQTGFAEDHHRQLTVEFGHDLDVFAHDPEAAQLIKNGLLPDDTLESAHVSKMPCCTCVQAVCKRNDGRALVIFEHDDKETEERFGDRPHIWVSCKDKQCCLVGQNQQTVTN